jgi:hypothetical protein
LRLHGHAHTWACSTTMGAWPPWLSGHADSEGNLLPPAITGTETECRFASAGMPSRLPDHCQFADRCTRRVVSLRMKSCQGLADGLNLPPITTLHRWYAHLDLQSSLPWSTRLDSYARWLLGSLSHGCCRQIVLLPHRRSEPDMQCAIGHCDGRMCWDECWGVLHVSSLPAWVLLSIAWASVAPRKSTWESAWLCYLQPVLYRMHHYYMSLVGRLHINSPNSLNSPYTLNTQTHPPAPEHGNAPPSALPSLQT